ncbi:hypothetical protein B0E46_15640 [Rhodanobacter sp. B04]|uniref:hypothetical protein n=1 Tax=Rhodanobacter sp. B04 TaxID=1945860 RepID=UPI0009871C41|nr:hypothetical protein [Rhodanobacter sp. B04]OOG61410.1 hypothetical protein B0E46_15640 [Rhodanobacter sp. B04]
MLIRRGHARWRIDWSGEGSPEPGHLVRHVTPGGRVSYARVRSVRVIRNRMPLPNGATCRYSVAVQRLDEKPVDPVDWTCHVYASPKRRPRLADSFGSADPAIDPWSPLL